MKKYLITGGAGFIGSHLVDALVDRGDSVVVLDDLSSGHLENLARVRDRIEFIEGDIRDPDTCLRASAGCDGIFHEAALVSVADSIRRPRDNHDINLTGTVNLLEAARENGVRRMVMAGSAAVYGNEPTLPKRETMNPDPITPYAVAKLASEYELKTYAAMYGMEGVSLRYFNVYGPRQDPSSPYSGVISRFADALQRDDKPVIFGDGTQGRDFIYVGDVVRANLMAMDAAPGASFGIYNVGTGRETSLLKLIDVLANIFDREVQPRFEPPREGDIRHSVAAIDAIGSAFGFRPECDLAAGLKHLVGRTTDCPDGTDKK
ncbi:NAD-dependent epimerase/dehydratase family protein [Kiritimatiella glycovorans]|uniref:UDP-glucose 4-epimerase n=1 Tax=Kiritimatiella glycovorans TaxID=1307763 RepID=A0A0G3EJC0_9BACT|nr:NAD-dependent epimerase/dehydratase family protein [Kiritimatiella glycovorans]AKJ65532.1 UDP-glucose 4-epimerase [Kiritimatiella glycovorans]